MSRGGGDRQIRRSRGPGGVPRPPPAAEAARLPEDAGRAVDAALARATSRFGRLVSRLTKWVKDADEIPQGEFFGAGRDAVLLELFVTAERAITALAHAQDLAQRQVRACRREPWITTWLDGATPAYLHLFGWLKTWGFTESRMFGEFPALGWHRTRVLPRKFAIAPATFAAFQRTHERLLGLVAESKGPGGPAAKADPPAVRKPNWDRLAFRRRGHTYRIVLDGRETFAVTPPQWALMKALAQAKGGLVTFGDLARSRAYHELVAGKNPTTESRSLPGPLRAMITSIKRVGFRMNEY